MSDLEKFLEIAQQLEAKNDWIQAINGRADAMALARGRPHSEPVPRSKENSCLLEELGDKWQPTKRKHDYLRRYDFHFQPRRLEAKKVMEIGVQSEKSVQLWKEYFPNAEIHGLDIDPNCKQFEDDRITIHIGDQMDERFLTQVVADTGGDFDIIIDDGLHTEYAILKTFSYLYPALSDHGLYVIEDIIDQPNTLAFVGLCLQAVNYWPSTAGPLDWPCMQQFMPDPGWFVSHTTGVSLYRYLAFIERGFNPRDNPWLISREELDQKDAAERQFVRDAVRDMRKRGVEITDQNIINEVGGFYRYVIQWLKDNEGL